MKKTIEGPEGNLTMFLVGLPAIVVDMFIAGMTWREALAARGMFILLKTALGGKYALTRDHFVTYAQNNNWPKPKLMVDALWYTAFCSGIYAAVLFVIQKPLEDSLYALAFITFTAPIGGPLAGVILDFLRKLFARFSSRAR